MVNLYLLQQFELINSIYKNNSYMDYIINIEDFFDLLGIYVYKNWIKGELVEVQIMDYYINIILKYNQKEAPDPMGATVLRKYGCKVKYQKTKEKVFKDDIDPFNIQKQIKGNIEFLTKPCWIIDILIPKKMIVTDNIIDFDSLLEDLERQKEELNISNPEDMFENK